MTHALENRQEFIGRMSEKAESRKLSWKARLAILLSASAVAIGATDALHIHVSDNPVSVSGEKTVLVHNGDTLDGIIANDIKGSGNVDLGAVEQVIARDPANAKIFKNGSLGNLYPGEKIEIPKEVK
jgi:transcription termination factor Rho